MTKRYPIRCFAGTLNAVVSPNGDVFACEQLKAKLDKQEEINKTLFNRLSKIEETLNKK